MVVAACASIPGKPPAPPGVGPSRPVEAAPATPSPSRSADASYTFRYVAAPSPFVEISLTTQSAQAGPTTFDLGTGFANVSDPEAGIRDVSASDDRGDKLTITQPTRRTWRVDAAPGRRITLRYAVFSSHHPGFRDRFRTTVTEHFIHFNGDLALMYPTGLGNGKHAIRFTWEGLDGAKLAPATSFGAGKTVEVHETFEAFRHAIFLASDAMRLTARPVGAGTVELAVIGTWPFSDAELADYLVRMVTMERGFFDDPGPPYFFVSVYPLGDGKGSYGGTGYTHSFDLALSPGYSFNETLRATLAHEHFHSWSVDLLTSEALESLNFWFSEGFTNFYTARLRYRAGMLSLEDYAGELNDGITRYLRSPARDAPNARTTAFWRDPFVQKLPYDRGHMIALVADREIRRTSGGKVSLDDVMRTLVQASRKGAAVTSDQILAMIENLTSTAFAARLRATVIDGAVLAIPPGLLAPCLTATPAPTWIYDLGFDMPASEATRRITDVRAGSAAARAGLRDGDALNGFSITHGDPDREVELRIGPDRRKVTYLPRGKPITIPRFAAHDAAACAEILGPPLP